MAYRLSPERAARLLDAYGVLLTERQREVLALVYEEDWSLAEVAEVYGTSRAAVADIVERASRQLEHWEARLGLVARREASEPALRRLLSALAEVPAVERRTAALAALKELSDLMGLDGLDLGTIEGAVFDGGRRTDRV
jgi:predicted DNA-binding protein YlxM (UPF0122 family)